MVKFSQFS